MDFLEDRARKADEAGDLTSALTLWSELAHRQRDPVFFLRYGHVARELERWEEAEGAIDEAIRLDPNSALAFELMGILWSKRTDKEDSESFEIAKRFFLKAAAIDRNPRILTLLGCNYRDLEDGAAARAAFTEAIELDPDYEEALYNLASVQAETDPQRSIELLERAVTIDPDYFLAHQELGSLYHKLKDLPKAEYHFLRCLEIDPADYWSLLHLANNLAVQGRNDEAEQRYRVAITMYAEMKGGYEFFANFLDSIGKQQDASQVRAAGKLVS